MYDFQAIMTSHGFTRDSYDFESTIAGFDHDIHFALFDDDSIFDVDRSHSCRQWDNPCALVRAELLTRDGNLDNALQFFQSRWLSKLRYQNPQREIIDVYRSSDVIAVHVLTISKQNAITLLFNIR